jgi:uncharacterized repeat protein (TIGR01451 family)
LGIGLVASQARADLPDPLPAQPRWPNATTDVPITDDLVITQSVTLQPGTYAIEDVNQDGVIQIAGDDITLDGTGVTLDGVNFGGYGIVMNGHTGLTLRNFTIQRFDYGVRVENATDVLIEGSDISGNRKDTSSTWLDINVATPTYGGGVLFLDVDHSTVQSNTLTHQSTGVELFSSHYNAILSNTLSSGPAGNEAQQNSCWGVRLYTSTHNLIQGNQADYVDRERYGLSSGDSAGVLLVYHSDENQVIGNSFTHSGDGFFIGNENGAPSNHNYIAGNDGSYSPHNAFETTFSEGNVFESNIASHSHYGFWLGYSYNTQVISNEINDNSAVGVAIEHGHDNTIISNTIVSNPTGVRLWDDATDNPSADYTIRGNTLTTNTTAIAIEDTDRVSIAYNQIADNTQRGVWVQSMSNGVNLAHNDITCQGGACAYAVVNGMPGGRHVTAHHNWWGTATIGGIESAIYDHVDDSAKGYVYYAPFRQEPVGTSTYQPDYVPLTNATINGPTTGAAQAYYTFITAAVPSTATRPITYVWQTAEQSLITHTGDLSDVATLAWSTPGAQTITVAATNTAGTVASTHVITISGNGDPQPPTCGPEIDAWSETTALPQAMGTPFLGAGRQLITYNGHAYFFSNGYDHDPRPTTAYYSPIDADGALGPWTETASPPGEYYDHAVVRVGDYIYFITGAADSTAVYYAPINADGSLGTWVSTTSLTPSRQNFAAVAYGDHIYVSGGNATGTREFVKVTSVNADGSLDTWADTTPLPEAIEGHTMVAHDGRLYVLAPNSAVYHAPINADGTVGDWAVTTAMPQAMTRYATVECSDHLYLLGGGSASVIYAPVLDGGALGQWRTTTPLPEQRNRLRVGAHNCVLYAGGGYDGSSYRDTVYYTQLPVALTEVSISGPEAGDVQTEHTFTATVSPVTATTPMTYTWQATGQREVLTTTDDLDHSISFAWDTPGTKTINVTVSNGWHSVTDSYTITISSSSGIVCDEETVSVPFAGGLSAFTTSGAYTGDVTLIVSGVGQAAGAKYSDAFYVFTDENGDPITPWHSTLQYNWVMWINGQHAENLIPDRQVPAYRGDHIYTFPIDAPGGNLTFGVGDTGTGDNTGSYTVTIRSNCQLTGTVTKAVNEEEANPGDVLTYTITLNGAGNTFAITDTVPEHTTYVPNSANEGATYVTETDSVHWSGVVPDGQPIELTFQTTVDEGTSSGTVITNAAAWMNPGQPDQRYSNVVTTVVESLSPPRNLVARTGLDAVLLEWDPSFSPDVTGYHIYRRASDETDFTRLTRTPVAGLSYQDTDVISGTTCVYHATAVDDAGRESGPSDAVMVVFGQLRLVIPTVHASPGMTVPVPVNIENADGLCIEAMDIGVQYDAQIASAVGVTRTALTQGYAFELALRSNEEVHISTIGNCHELYGPGSLFWIDFYVHPTATVDSSLDFVHGLTGTVVYDESNLNDPVPLSLMDGLLVVDSQYIMGDLNGDSVVNSADAAIALRIAVGTTTPTPKQRAAGDVNGDGVINAADAAMILYYAAHQEWPLPNDMSANALSEIQSGSVSVEPSAVTGRIGEEVEVPILVSEGAGMAGGTFVVRYGSGLSYQSAWLDDVLDAEGYHFATRVPAPGEVWISLAGSTVLPAGEQTIMWLRFRVDEETTVEVTGAWLNDQAGRDFATSALQQTVIGGKAVVRTTQSSHIYLPLVLRK